MILGTSGSGKTRTIYEFLCKHFGIHLVAVTGLENYGSTDMWNMISALNRTLDSNFPQKNDSYVRGYVQCIMAARFFVLKNLLSEGVIMTPKSWLFIQILSTGRDWFRELVDIFRTVDFDVLERKSREYLDFVSPKIGINGDAIPVFLDEVLF